MNRPAQAEHGQPPVLTVAIPSWNRHDLLRDTLASLASTCPDAPIEVVVIDDGSDPAYDPQLILPSPARWPLSIIRTEGIGANAARNLAMESSRTEWVAILDDDVYILPGWFEALQAAQSREGVLAVAGRINIHYDAPPPLWLDEDLFDGHLAKRDLGDEPILGGVLPYSANCAVTKRMWREVGGFFPGLDRRAGALLSGGETEFFSRAEELGLGILYEPKAAVLHRFSADRLSYDYFARRAYWQGCTDSIVDGGAGGLGSEVTTLARSLYYTSVAEFNRATRRRTGASDRTWRQYAHGWLHGSRSFRHLRRQLTQFRSESETFSQTSA